MSETLELFGEMLEAGVKPDTFAVNYLLSAFARDARHYWTHAKTIYEVGD